MTRQVRVMADALLKDFDTLLDTTDITHPDPGERRRKLLSRALAALVVRDRMGCDSATAAAMVTDGGQDFGIDAVAIGAGAPHLWFIQTKWSDRAEAPFGEREVMVIADGLRMIDHQQFNRFNQRFQPYVERIRAIWADRHCKVTLVLAVTRKDPLHDNVLRRLDDVKANFNVHGTYLDVEVLYIEDLWELVRRKALADPIHLSIALDQWFYISTPMPAVSGVVLAADVAEWHADHGDALFVKNIRESLGVTQVNAEISRSLAEEPFDFWYRNNGIIMLCDRLRLAPNSRSAPHGPATVDVEGASVVNGAQTVAAVAAAVAKSSDAGQGLVGVRVIQSSEPAVSVQITKATNTQNHIERRDFVALDRVQIAIREEFALTLGLTYAIRRSELEPSPQSGCTVREAAIALACAHPNPELALLARHNEDLLWEEGSRGAYQQIFGVRPPAIQIWRSVRLFRAVRDALHQSQGEREGRAAAVAEHGSLIVAHLVFQRLGRDGIDDQDFDWDPALTQIPNYVTEALHWLVGEVDRQFGANSFIGATFSSPERVRSLARQVLTGWESGTEPPELPADYRRAPRQRKTRRPNTVMLLVNAGRIKDGTQLSYEPSGETEKAAMEGWLVEDPRRVRATWVNNRSKPLVWAADGKRYSPTGLVMRMWASAEWSAAPVAVQGPSRWRVPGEGTLVELAQAVQRESELPLDDEEDTP